jgi:hypothetical protein
MKNDILSYVQKTPFDIQLNELVLKSIISKEEFDMLLNSDCNIYFSDLITLFNKICNYDEIRKKILEHRFNIIKIDNNNNLRISPSKIKKLLYLNKNIKYTKDQKQGIKKILEFLLDHNRKIFGFFGFAGTGKTTTLTTLVTQFIKFKMYKRIALVAPTNKAVSVIKNKFMPFLIEFIGEQNIPENLSFDLMIDELKTKDIYIDFITIHKLLNISTDFDMGGKIVFVTTEKNKPEISNYDLIIIDECSMISIPMIDQLLVEIRKLNIKVIFSGDPAQLPPINEKVSSIFINHHDDLTLHRYRDILNRDKDKNKKIYTHNLLNSFLQERHNLFIEDLLNMKRYTLTDVVRSKKNAVTKTSLLIRHWIENKFEFPPLEKYKDLDGVIFYESEEDWIKNIIKDFKNNKHNNIVLTWTNNKSDEYNNTIRNSIFGRKDLKRFEIGDILILNDFYQIKNEKKPIMIYTSEHICIQDIKIINIELKLFENIQTEINFKRFKNEQLLIKKFTEFYKSILNFYKLSYKCYELKVNKLGDLNKLTIYVIHDDDYFAYDKIISLIQNNIRKFLLSISPDLNKQKQVSEIIGKPLWKHFYEICVDRFATVSYGYSITCHKAQGSNYYNVYVDANDILKNNKDTEMKRCLYTAFTRTVNNLNILF